MWAPDGVKLVGNVATPLTSVPVPMETPPSLKVTVPPVGVVDPVCPGTGVMVAVSVVCWPTKEGLMELVTEAVAVY